MVHSNQWLLLPILCLVAIGLSGCSDSGVSTAAVTGNITVNGQARKGIYIEFVPKSGDRPSVAATDENGDFRMQFLKNQSGVALGPCVVKFTITKGDSERNYLPPEYNAKAADNPDLNVEVPAEGMEFNYDIPFDGKLPPVE